MARSVIVGLAVLACLALPGATLTLPTPLTSVGTSLEQCENGTSGIGECTGSAWITGNLNPNNSLYREGDFVPFRSVITSLVAGRTYALRIGYDAVEKDLHAYDYLGSVDGSETQKVVPCDGVAGTTGPHACGRFPSTLAVPKDTHTTFPPGSPGQASGKFSAWGANLTDAAYVNPTPIGRVASNTIKREIDVSFTAAGDTVVLAWGGHIASVLDWGAGKTFISAASGSSFHMRLVQIKESGGPVYSTGNRELSLQASALAPVPSQFTTQVAPTTVAVGEPVIDTARLTGRPGFPVTGEVQFFVCGAAATPPSCLQGGSAIEPPEIVVAASPNSPDGLASIQYIPERPGNYCFRAQYTPSATAPYSPAVHTNPATECFVATLPPPRLTVTKICIPTNDPGLFSLLLDGVAFGLATNVSCGHSEGPHEVPAGAHTVSEMAGTGTDLADYTSTIGGSCAADGSIALGPGDSAHCIITNVNNGSGAVTGTLTVNKVCVPPTDDGLFDLTIDAKAWTDQPCGGTTGAVTVAAGAHTVGEASGTGTSLSDYTTVIGGDCAADGSVTVAAGGSATCTITNTRKPPPPATLRVDKLCIPAGDDGMFRITIDGKPVKTVGCGGTTGAVEVSAGSHTVGETGAGGTDLSDYTVVKGGDCEADGSVVVEAGDEATCTITNIHRSTPPVVLPPMIAVQKICVPSDDGGLFNLMIDGRTSADQPCGDRFGPVVVSPGVHNVSETAGTGTSLSDYTSSIGGDCSPDGSVTVAAGQSGTCTITNVRADHATGDDTATITIVKQCKPAGVLARFQLNLDDQVFQGMKCGDSTGPVVISTGPHSVGEVAVQARPDRFKTTISGDCSPQGAITLTAGQHATCIVTNVRRTLRPFRPPAACYRLTVARRMVTVGQRVLIVARVNLHRRPIRGVRVYAAGPGVSGFRTTGPRGKAVFVLRLGRAGIVRLTIRKPFACPHPPPKRIGVLGASQTFLTG